MISEIISSLHPSSIMISGGEPGTRNDIIELLLKLKPICENISVFTNGLFIERYFEFIIESGWPKLKFQVSIPDKGLSSRMLEKIKTIVEKGYIVDGYMIVDAFFEAKRRLIEEMSMLFTSLYFQPLAVPHHHYLYKTTLNCCSAENINKIVEMMCEYSPQCTDFYRYVGRYYNKNLLERILRLDAICTVGESAFFLNPDLTFARCLHSSQEKMESYSYAKECCSDRCICLARINFEN